MNPRSRDDVLAGLKEAQTTWMTYAQTLPLTTFFQATAPGRWAPVKHLRHLTLTHRRITQGLSVPRPALRLMFGKPSREGRSYPALVTAYQAALAAGAKATDRYVPAQDDAVSEAVRAGVLKTYTQEAQAVRGALGRWPETALDTHALPHALLGRLSVREMAFFALYHGLHHLRGVQAALETP